MTGSIWVLIVVPIAAMIALAGWLAMVYYAEAHPEWKAHRVAAEPGSTGTTAYADSHRQIARRGVTTVVKHGEEAAEPGVYPGSGQVPAQKPQRAA